jgi:hypothetical protein
MALFIVGGNFLAMKIIRETTEIKVFYSSLIKFSMKFGLQNYVYFLALFVPTPVLMTLLLYIVLIDKISFSVLLWFPVTKK